MKKLLLVIPLLAVVSGCANMKPFGEAAVGYELRESERFGDSCKWPATFKVGGELPNSLKVYLQHRSNVECGTPFNDLHEYWQDSIGVSYQIGGHK